MCMCAYKFFHFIGIESRLLCIWYKWELTMRNICKLMQIFSHVWGDLWLQLTDVREKLSHKSLIVYACVSTGFCALNILSKFGELSGLSSAPFDSSILKLMSEVDNSGSDLRGDSQTKAKWILSMVTLNSASMFCVQGAYFVDTIAAWPNWFVVLVVIVKHLQVHVRFWHFGALTWLLWSIFHRL